MINRSGWCVGPDFLHKEVSLESLGINSRTNNTQDDTVLPDDITNEHSEKKETKLTNSTSKNQSNFASKINWGRYSSFFTLTRHVAWIIKPKTNWIKSKKGSTTKRYKHQVILSKYHHETQLILRNTYKNNLNVGQKHCW